MRRLLFTIAILILSQSPCLADLKGLIEKALRNNELIRSAQMHEKAEVFHYKSIRGMLYPKIWLQQEGIRSNNPPFVWMSKMSRSDVSQDMMNLKGFNDPDAVTNFSSSINIAYPLFYGGAIKNAVEAGKLGAKIAERMKELTQEGIAFEVVKTYLEVAWLKSRVKAAKSSVKSAEYHLKQAESRYQAGVALKSDVLKAKVFLSAAKEKLIREETQLDIAERKLSVITGGDPLVPTRIDTDVEKLYSELSRYTPNIANAVEEAFKNRKDLKTKRLKVEIAKRKLRIAKAKYLPQVDLFSSFNWYGHNYPLQGEQSSWTIGGAIKITLFDGLSREYNIKKAKADKTRAEYEYIYGEKEVSLEVISALKSIEEARQRLTLAKDSVREAEESLRIMEERYQQGLATITELTDTHRYLDEARAMYLGALHSYLLAIYRSEYVKGTLLKFIGVKEDQQ